MPTWERPLAPFRPGAKALEEKASVNSTLQGRKFLVEGTEGASFRYLRAPVSCVRNKTAAHGSAVRVPIKILWSSTECLIFTD